MRATCRAGRDWIDQSQFWAQLIAQKFPEQAAHHSIDKPHGKTAYLLAARANAQSQLWHSAQERCQETVTKAQQNAFLATLTLAQLSALPCAIVISPLYGALMGASLSTVGICSLVKLIPADSDHGSLLVLLGAPAAIATSTAVGAVMGGPVLVAGMTSTAILGPMYFGSAAAAHLCGGFGKLLPLLGGPSARRLAREWLRSSH